MFKNMIFFRNIVIAFILLLPLTLLWRCNDENAADNREHEYGYVQFKLYKEASYIGSTDDGDQTRVTKNKLDYLNESSKIMVTLRYEDGDITQTLVLNSANKESAEFGLRSDKLSLTSGKYQVITFTLYDANDEVLYKGVPTQNNELIITPGGLTVYDLTINVQPRGFVKFRFVKDLSSFANTPKTKATTKEYAFYDIGKVDITVINKETKVQTQFTGLLTTINTIIGGDDKSSPTYQTTVLKCDTTLSLQSGDYEILSYATYENTKPIKNAKILETNTTPAKYPFSIKDNSTTDADVGIALYESDAYIKDYYALYQIWLALDGPNWSYRGNSYPNGINWDFNRSPDLWGAQPGVSIHSNGRIASITFSGFRIKGDMPADIGQLSELIQLTMGNHTDDGLSPNDQTDQYSSTLYPSDIDHLSRMEKAKQESYMKYSQRIRPLFMDMTSEENVVKDMIASISPKSVTVRNYMKYVGNKTYDPGLFEVNYGKLYNGLKSLPEEIGNLKKLTTIYIANGEIESLPESMAELTGCTDLEIYNCPKMKKFPMSITKMPELISVNISNNKQISSEELYKGLDALAKGPSREKIQLLYSTDNNLKEIPVSFANLKKLGLLDFTNNKISKIHPLGKDIRPVQFFLDYNELTAIPSNADGIYCGMEDIELFSVTNNKLTTFPNIFSAKFNVLIGTVDFSFNKINKFEGDENGSFKGVFMDILKLNNNPLGIFPTCFAKTNSYMNGIELDGCEIAEVPKGSFLNENVYNDNFSSMSTIILSNNRIKELPAEFDGRRFPFLYGLSLSNNAFSKFPYVAANITNLTILLLSHQRDDQGRRSLSEWPVGVWQHKGLRQLDLTSNNLGKITERLSPNMILLIYDNPNLSMDISTICPYLLAGYKILYYDDNQDLRGCNDLFND